MLFGFAVFFASIAMLLAPIAFVVIIDRMVIPLEEQNMERLFSIVIHAITRRAFGAGSKGVRKCLSKEF